jgi:hypothetical protein
MAKKYEINLVQIIKSENTVVDNNFLLSYDWYEIPQVGDEIHIKENKIALVKRRLLPSTDSNRVILFVTIE